MRTLRMGMMVAGVCALLAGQTVQARTWVVDQGDANAADTNEGTADAPFQTIGAAAEKAMPGDTVLVHAGVYRERVAPARGGEEGKPIVYQAADGETVCIRGSEHWKPRWRTVDADKGTYEGDLDDALFSRGVPEGGRKPFNPFATPLHKQPRGMVQGQVLLDGEPLIQVLSQDKLTAMAGTWMVTGNGKGLMVHFPPRTGDPSKRRVEVTVRGRVFAPIKRGLGYVTVRGFTIEHCANDFPQGFYANGIPHAGALGTRAGHHWVIENNVIRHARAMGLDIGSEGDRDYDGLHQPEPKYVGYHVVRNNVIADNGQCGIGGYRGMHSKVIGNVIARNNWLGFGGAENAGMKAHFFVDGLIEGNLFLDNETSGLWLDNVWAHSRVTRNVFVGNRGAAVMFEMGVGPVLFDNNIVADTQGIHNASGVYSHDAGGMTIVHNLIVSNAHWGVYIRGNITGRSAAVYPKDVKSWEESASGKKKCLPKDIRILNNLIVANGRGAINMPFPGPNLKTNEVDYNAYNTGGMMSWTYFVPFVTNTNGGLSFAQMQEVLHKAMIDRKGGEVEPPELVNYHKGPLLSLDQWRLMTEFDLHGAVPAGKGNPVEGSVSAGSLVGQIKLGGTVAKMGCKPIEGVDHDFLGRAIPKDGPVQPGPVQNMQEAGRFHLWPVRGAGAPPQSPRP